MSAAQQQLANARRASERAAREAKPGDTVYDLLSNRYASVVRAFKNSVRLSAGGPGWSAPRERLVWLHFNEIKRCITLDIPIGAGAYGALQRHDAQRLAVYDEKELKAMDEIESFEAGDSVTPMLGVFRGTRFVVLDKRPRAEHPGDELLVRPFPARQGGPAPLWVPAAELAPFFSPRACRVCGDVGHQRCEQAPEFPEVGWRVCTQLQLSHELGIPAGVEGTVAISDRRLGAIRVELDDGSIADWGASIVKLFFFEMRVL